MTCTVELEGRLQSCLLGHFALGQRLLALALGSVQVVDMGVAVLAEVQL